MSQLKVNHRISIPLSEISFQFSRSSGAGGQNVNKVNTRVSLRWIPAKTEAFNSATLARLLTKAGRRVNSEGILQISSQRYRDQGRNVADCLEKLRALVFSIAEPPKKRLKTRPSKAVKKKRLDQKRAHSQKKKDRKPPHHE